MEKEIQFHAVMLQKGGVDGLTKAEITRLLDMLPDDAEVYPIDLEARDHECSAQGFILSEGADMIDFDYEASGFHDFVAEIMDDMENESPDCIYCFDGKIKFYLGY